MKVSHAIVWFIFLSHKGDPAQSPFRNAGAFMQAVFHLSPYLSLTTSSWHLLMTVSWCAEEPCLGSAVECYPLSFIFPDETNGALRDFRFIFSSFLFCGSFCIIAGISGFQHVHFAFPPLVPLSQRSWFLIWILQVFAGYVFFIIWKTTVSYEKVTTFLPIFNKYSN